MPGGIGPDTRLFARPRVCRCLERLPTDAGIVPLSLLSSMESATKLLQLLRRSRNSSSLPDISIVTGQSLPTSGGTCPLKLLLARLSVARPEALAIAAGIGPASQLPPRRRYRRLDMRAPESGGSGSGRRPWNALLARFSCCSDDRLKKPGGISPRKLFWWTSKTSMEERRERPSGIGPSRRFWSSVRIWSFVRLPSDGGISPDKEFWLR